MSKFLCLKDQKGKIYIALEDIIRLEADDNYTILHIRNGRKITQSGSLGSFFSRVKPEGTFYRVHRSHVLNLVYVYRVDDDCFVTMTDGSIVPITGDARVAIIGNIPSC